MKKAPLYGLVMAGGFSRRMGRDKAMLDYHGKPQARWTADLVSPFCERVFFSCRDGQDLGDSLRYPRIYDEYEDAGPLLGMVSAAHRFPDAAWLVVACDLPLLTAEVLEHLVKHRAGDAVAYRSASDGLPEPLCAVYEPAFAAVWEDAVKREKRCPRKLLIQAADRVTILDPIALHALDNVNTVDAYRELTEERDP